MNQQESVRARRGPRPGEIETPLFKAIWRIVKNWEIQTENGSWYSCTGDDVCGIIDAIAAQPSKDYAPTLTLTGNDVMSAYFKTSGGTLQPMTNERADAIAADLNALAPKDYAPTPQVALRRWANIGPTGEMQEHPLGEFVLLNDVAQMHDDENECDPDGSRRKQSWQDGYKAALAPKDNAAPAAQDLVKRLLQADLAFIALRDRLECIALIIEAIDRRCGAADGPVAQTRDEITAQELRDIYKLAAKDRHREPISIGTNLRGHHATKR